MSKLILVGMILWTMGVLLYVKDQTGSSSYAKGYQVRLCGKQWGV